MSTAACADPEALQGWWAFMQNNVSEHSDHHFASSTREHSSVNCVAAPRAAPDARRASSKLELAASG